MIGILKQYLDPEKVQVTALTTGDRKIVTMKAKHVTANTTTFIHVGIVLKAFFGINEVRTAQRGDVIIKVGARNGFRAFR